MAIFVVGFAMAWFYYEKGHLFSSRSKLGRGTRFALFVYLSNYIPQVFFLDATNGLRTLVNGGFPVIQVELFDLLILAFTVWLMVLFMPLKRSDGIMSATVKAGRPLLCGITFAAIMSVAEEVLLPLVGVPGMASSLRVAAPDLLFFYAVMALGFIMAGSLVSYEAMKDGDALFCLKYGALIWCAFDLTMVPLGFGVMAMLAFVATSLVAFFSIGKLVSLFSPNGANGAATEGSGSN